MANKRLIFVAVFIIVLPASGQVTENPVLRNPAAVNPAGSATVVPSSLQSGLFTMPNPLSPNGNLTVTGNVAGGKHFRGIVPYNSISDFSGTGDSSSIDSFLRYSAGVQESYTGLTTPYYPQRGTVTTTGVGSSIVIRPPVLSVGGQQAGEFSLPNVPGQKDYFVAETDIPTVLYRPMSRTPAELERTISSELEQARIKVTEQQNKAGMEVFLRDIKKISDKADKLKEGLTEDKDEGFLLEPVKIETGLEFQRKSEEIPTLKQLAGEEAMPVDVYEQMLERINEFNKTDRQKEDTQPVKSAGRLKAEDDKLGHKQQGKEVSLRDRLAEIDLASAKARELLGPYRTFASYTADKFNEHMRAGEKYLKAGNYYRAADAYTLASVYKPKDPLAYAGKSYALLAAGEYMSSALFLARALEIFSGYASLEIDLVAMIGDKDLLETRIADLRELLGLRKVPELFFLLSYVFYQMDRLEFAKQCIDAAYEEMPDSKAVGTLKDAIYNRIKSF